MKKANASVITESSLLFRMGQEIVERQPHNQWGCFLRERKRERESERRPLSVIG
jgi:hypothetical protein